MSIRDNVRSCNVQIVDWVGVRASRSILHSVPGIETSFKFLDREKRCMCVRANIYLEYTPDNLSVSTGSLELYTSRGATSHDTFRSPSSWPVAIYSRNMLAVCYTGCWPLFSAGPAAAILSYSCMSVCGVAGRQSPCRDEECVAVCCCADVPSCLLYKRLHSWRSVLLSSSCVVLTCVYILAKFSLVYK